MPSRTGGMRNSGRSSAARKTKRSKGTTTTATGKTASRATATARGVSRSKPSATYPAGPWCATCAYAIASQSRSIPHAKRRRLADCLTLDEVYADENGPSGTPRKLFLYTCLEHFTSRKERLAILIVKDQAVDRGMIYETVGWVSRNIAWCLRR